MLKLAFIAGFALLIVRQATARAISYGDDCETANPPSLMVEPQEEQCSSTSFQPSGGKYIEVAVITAPSGPSPMVPESSSFSDPAIVPVTNSFDDNSGFVGDPKSSTSDISVEVIVDDSHELFFNGRGQGWKKSGYQTKVTYNFQGVKSGDVIGISGKDLRGYAGMLVQINFLSGPYAGTKHVTKQGWICSRHKPQDDSWMKSDFTNAGKYNWRRRFLNAVGHGGRDSWPWEGLGAIQTYDQSAEWFWVAHNFLVDKAWCRYEFDFSQPQGDRKGESKKRNKNDDNDDDVDE